jgi:glutamine amidotransferase
MNATILDYGAGNLHSLAKALDGDGFSVRITDDPIAALATDLLVLPGVGSFPYAAAALAPARDEVRRAILGGLPTLGICLGMQLFFASSDEGAGRGLGVFDGRVVRLDAPRLPHIGWNSLDDVADDDLRSSGLASVYYANSFVCRPAESSDVRAWTTYDTARFPAMIRRGRVAGMQFHPEKSSAAGVRALRAVARGLVA